ncbi:MAG TPA: PQQ-dependent sugar dehydrogenase [Gemmatimonadaceae bacterium]|nr:PQQ-dependent sugar dehydrogenase [Gemmatimonadaceae bacterium]
MGPEPPDPPEQLPEALALQLVAEGLSNPLFLTAPRGDARLFVVEQVGRIRIVENGQLLSTPFLDLVGQITSGDERGLLGLAFHPDYASNGFFYVNYTDRDGDTRVERYRVSANPSVADESSAKHILGVAQPFANHNGGMLLFGDDGMLYIALGDGGSGGDPHGNGQNGQSLLGKLLRIDVDGGDPYAIPAGNPFAGSTSGRGEVWAMGLRNPWRLSFDRETEELYVADVGEQNWEEVNVVPGTAAGINYGWNLMEGGHCFLVPTCDQAGLTLPVLEYDHSDGCSVIGGYVYRGSAIPGLAGHYLYSDLCSAWLRSFRYADGRANDARDWDIADIGAVLSFGEDAAGEIYLLSATGHVYRIVAGD